MNNVIYMDDNLVGSYIPLYQRDFLIFLLFVKKYQASGSFIVSLNEDELRGVFPDVNVRATFKNILKNFAETISDTPFFIEIWENRKIEYFVKECSFDGSRVELVFNDNAASYFKDVDDKYYLNLEYLINMKSDRNRLPYDMKLYMDISYKYGLHNTEEDRYIIFLPEVLYFSLSTFKWNHEDGINAYLSGKPVIDMVRFHDIRPKYKGSTAIWTNVFYFISSSLNNINANTDIYIDKKIVPLIDYNDNKTIVGAIFKVKKNPEVKRLSFKTMGIDKNDLILQERLKQIYEKS